MQISFQIPAVVVMVVPILELRESILMSSLSVFYTKSHYWPLTYWNSGHEKVGRTCDNVIKYSVIVLKTLQLHAGGDDSENIHESVVSDGMTKFYEIV